MKDTIISMLLENTGKHPMDSGGANGRRWQRNQFRDFESEEPITFEVNINYNEDGTVRYRDIIPTITLYHWLMGANIEEDERAEEFNALIDNADPWCENLSFTTEQCYQKLMEWDADIDDERCYNTYNDSDCLDQVIQYQHLTIGDDPYVLISVHGGADVRGGYAASRLFYLDETIMDMLWNEQYNRCMDEDEARSHLEHGQPFILCRWGGDTDETINNCTDLKWIQE
jgi:hypothetical protein